MEQFSCRTVTRLAAIAAIAFAFAVPAYSQSPIAIVSPHPGEQVGGRALYLIRWTSPAIPGNAGFVVYFTDAEGEQTICRAPAAARECEWQYPGSTSGFTGTLFVDARDSNGVSLATTQFPPFQIVDENLGNEWEGYSDIGDVGRSGGVRVTEDGTYIVRGAGDDVWATADAFHYVWDPVIALDDVSFRATVTSIEGTEPWTKVGIMLRSHLQPWSPHHFLLASRSKGIAYQRRITDHGPTLHTTVDASSALPVTFHVVRRAFYTVLYVERDGGWEQVAAQSSMDWTFLGLAVSSHDKTVLATGTFTDVVYTINEDPKVTILEPEEGQEVMAGVPLTIQWIQTPAKTATVSYSVDDGQSWNVVPGCESTAVRSCVWNNVGPETERARIRVSVDDPDDPTEWAVTFPFAIRAGSPTALPPGWISGDVGDVSVGGGAAYDAATGQFTVSGSGADIWGTADELHFVSRAVIDDPQGGMEVTARVASVENVNRWTKVGIMVRAHRGAGAAHVSAFVTPSTLKGVAFQRRVSEGSVSTHTSGPAITAPVWLKFIVGNGGVRAYYRQAATDEWTFLGEDRVALTGAYEAGLAVSSHVDGTLARATFDNVSVVPHFGLFSGQVDIGRVGVLGGDAANDIERMLWGSGADIWGTADAFHYNYGAISPTGVISAQVRSIQNTHRWAKAGVMIRSDLTPGSPHVMLIVSAAMGVAMQYRAVPSGISASVRNEPGVAPKWVRLRRRGNTILGEVSDDGVTWNFFGAIDLPLGDVVTAGLAVTSHHNGKWAKGVFQDVLLLR